MAISDLPGFKYLVKNNSISYLVIILLIFGVGTLISIVHWHDTEVRANNVLVSKYLQELNQSKSVLSQGLNQYSLLLNDGASLLAVNNNNVSQSQWLTFFQSYHLASNYPGVDAVSFCQYVSAAQLPNFLSNLAAQGQANFTITPPGSRSVYAPVTYIGYISPTSLQAMGFDELSNPVRAAAIGQALSSGQIALSGPIKLVAVNKKQSAFIIYKPIYNGPASTLAERQSSIYGFVFIAVNSNDFFNALLGHYIGSGIAIKVYDGGLTNDALLYQTPDYARDVSHIANPVNTQVNVNFGGRTWNIKVVIAKSLIESGASQPSILDLIVGISISTLAAAVLWYFTYYRERKLYWQRQRDVQAAKDELLSLASHQLRTPATIVKQYLGILLQNYGGSVNKQQRKIIETAYDSNERQLEIANQFLDAARLGSGRIVLNKEPIVLNDVLRTVIADQHKIANERQQKITYTNPKRLYKIQGDSKYLPMVFENLINNAIKYSERRTKIDVSIRLSGSNIYISVSDQGMGIAEDALPTVFEKFTHAAYEHTGGNGTGIGLYLAKQIVSLHGGDISVVSTLGKGSKFTVSLPVKQA